MKLLGIDISTRDVALSLICTNTMKVLQTIKVEFPKGASIVEKIKALDTDNDLTELVLKEDIDRVYIEANITAMTGVLYKWVDLGYYHIVGYLMGQWNLDNVELINNNVWKKALGYVTPLKKDYETATLLKRAKETAAIVWVSSKFYGTKCIDSDNADAVLIAYGGYKNGKTN